MLIEYDKFNLNSSPFETYTHDYEMAGRKKEWDELTNTIQQYFNRGGCQFIVLIGAYGQGKTYTVTRVYKRFKEEFPATLVVTTVHSSPIRAMEPEPRITLFGLSIVQKIFNALGVEKLREIASKVDKKSLLSIEDRDSRQLFEALSSGNDELVNSAFYILTGQAQRGDVSSIGIGQMVRSSERSLRIFYEFLRFIKLADYANMLVLLDEFEFLIGTQSDKKLSSVLGTFRIMFDEIGARYTSNGASIASLVIVFAISPGGWQRLVDLESDSAKNAGIAPFMQRLRPDYRVDLEPFSLEDTKELIKIRLSKHRVRVNKEKPFYPFTEEAIEYIHNRGNHTPRKILQFAGIILEDAIIGGLTIIQKEDAKKILLKYPLPPSEYEE